MPRVDRTNATDVPFCAAGGKATAVDLERRSAPERVRSAAPTAPAAERGSVCFLMRAGGLRACSCCCARNGTLGAPLGRNGAGIMRHLSKRRSPTRYLTRFWPSSACHGAWIAQATSARPMRSHHRRCRSQGPRRDPRQSKSERGPWCWAIRSSRSGIAAAPF